MDHDSIRAGGRIGLRTLQRFFHAPSGDQRFDACEHHEIFVLFGAPRRFKLAAKFMNRREVLPAGDKTIHLGKTFILDDNGRNAGRFILLNHVNHVRGIAVSGITIANHRQRRGFVHRRGRLERLCHRQNIGIRNRVRSGNFQAARPYPVEAIALNELGS